MGFLGALECGGAYAPAVASPAAYASARAAVLAACRTNSDARALRLDVLEVLRRTIGFDGYAWLLTDPETSVGSSPLADVPCLPELPELIRLKYLTAINRWTSLPAQARTLARATGGDLATSLMWRDLLCRYRVTDIASAVYRDRFGCWGFLDLWRTQNAPPFAPAELDFLDDLAPALTTALRQSQARTFVPPEIGAPDVVGPVVLLLSPALTVRAQTPLTEQYMRVLVPPGAADRAPIPASALNVAAQLLANEAGLDDGLPLARLHLADGVWLTLRASRINSAEPEQDSDIAVSIEIAGSRDRLAVFSRGFGLTPRESQLVHHLVAGAATRNIAELMSVSENTVQDHLKSIFDKTGTRSRRTLVASAHGLRLS
jgi:DNA-binding CsgD family transcriptional regulator